MQKKSFLKAVENALFQENRTFLVEGENIAYRFESNGNIAVLNLSESPVVERESKYELFEESDKEYLKVDNRMLHLLDGPKYTETNLGLKIEISISESDDEKLFKRYGIV